MHGSNLTIYVIEKKCETNVCCFGAILFGNIDFDAIKWRGEGFLSFPTCAVFHSNEFVY